jgi:hypothetical protein
MPSKEQLKSETQSCWESVADTYNQSYSSGRDQEDHSLRPAWENSSQDPISKTPNRKKGRQSGSSGRGLTYQVWGLEFKPQYHQKERKEKKPEIESLLKLISLKTCIFIADTIL